MAIVKPCDRYVSVVEQRERGYSIRRVLKHKAEIEVDEFVRRIQLLFIKHTRFIYGLLLTKRKFEDIVPYFPSLFSCGVTGRKLMEDYAYIGLDFFFSM